MHAFRGFTGPSIRVSRSACDRRQKCLDRLSYSRPCAIDDKHKDTRVPSGEGLRWTKGAIPGNHDGERGDFHMAKFKLTAVLHRVVDQAFGTGKTKYESKKSLVLFDDLY